jgi:hypothetical protein
VAYIGCCWVGAQTGYPPSYKKSSPANLLPRGQPFIIPAASGPSIAGLGPVLFFIILQTQPGPCLLRVHTHAADNTGRPGPNGLERRGTRPGWGPPVFFVKTQVLRDTMCYGIRTGGGVCVIVCDSTGRSWQKTGALLRGWERERRSWAPRNPRGQPFSPSPAASGPSFAGLARLVSSSSEGPARPSFAP